MHALLAIGVPSWPSIGRGSFDGAAFDWSPLVLVIAALVVAPFVFGIRLTTFSIPVLVLGGITLGWLSAGIGALPAACLGLIGLAVASSWLRGSRARRAPRIVQLPD